MHIYIYILCARMHGCMNISYRSIFIFLHVNNYDKTIWHCMTGCQKESVSCSVFFSLKALISSSYSCGDALRWPNGSGYTDPYKMLQQWKYIYTKHLGSLIFLSSSSAASDSLLTSSNPWCAAASSAQLHCREGRALGFGAVFSPVPFTIVQSCWVRQVRRLMNPMLRTDCGKCWWNTAVWWQVQWKCSIFNMKSSKMAMCRNPWKYVFYTYFCTGKYGTNTAKYAPSTGGFWSTYTIRILFGFHTYSVRTLVYGLVRSFFFKITPEINGFPLKSIKNIGNRGKHTQHTLLVATSSLWPNKRAEKSRFSAARCLLAKIPPSKRLFADGNGI